MAEICVTLAREGHSNLYEEMETCRRQGVRLAEIRLDYLRRAPELQEILRRKPCPLIATVRRREDGGRWKGSEEQRLALVRAAVLAGFDYIDLEFNVADQIPRFGKCKRIVSIHDFEGMPENLEMLPQRFAQLDADIAKIACTVRDAEDNLDLLHLARRAPIPTVVIGMGEMGLPVRVLNAKFGSPHTYAASPEGRRVAPGILTLAEMREIYRYESIGPDTRVFGVLGDPVAQSVSPLVHNDGFAQLGLNAVYLPFWVSPDVLQRFMTDLSAWDIHGLSVTIPHKTKILEYGTAREELVTASAAANTMIREEDGGFGLYNTDGPAAIDALETALAALNGSTLKGKTVLIFGAGGAARTLALALLRRGAIVHITSRTDDKSHELARELGCVFVEWSARQSSRRDILVNCTPMGMFPHQMNEMPVHPSILHESGLVFDTVYNPEHTRLIREAAGRHCTVVTGVEMFVRQAERQFRLFTGHEPIPGRMATLVREALSPARRMLHEQRLAQELSAATSGQNPADSTQGEPIEPE